ncbi:PIG-L family deacetylase [Clostridium gasigenes]|uniref:PIG-L deacetylase family protein n=1 Tax=Clostridium gasigenes TaxID=94869 RepID=UPI001C0B909E|nr:PIG-L deacetylase family protein [Clostridium gasigenes]MBU3089818.1 PIG-L family deacetylase [Clostridium gasigenes]
MSISKFILKTTVPIPKILEYNTYIFIGAHPDDIECQCGGTIAKLIELGKKVSFIIVTDGRYGSQNINITQEELVIIRKNESYKAAEKLGVTNIKFLNFYDGGRYDIENVADKIAIELVCIKPDIIFTIDNHVKSEIHPDHLKVGRASELAFFKCSLPLIMNDLGSTNVAKPKGIAYYFTDKPNSFIKISKYFNLKIAAVSEHTSQFLSAEEGSASINEMIIMFKFDGIRYGIRCFSKYAEGFRVLSNKHLHCMPLSSKF